MRRSYLVIFLAYAACIGPAAAVASEKGDANKPPTNANEPYSGEGAGLPSSERPAPAPKDFEDPAKVWTLPELLDEALKHNPTTTQAWEQANVAAAQVGVAKAAYWPTVDLAVSGTASHETTANYPGTQENNQINVTPQLQIQYLLLDFGARKANVELNRFNLLSQNFTFNKSLQTVTLAVMSAYYNLDGAKAAVKNAESALALSEANLRSAEIKLKAGLGTSTDEAQARQSVEQGKFNLESARGALSTAEIQMAGSLGLTGNTKLEVAPPSNAPSLAMLEEEVDKLIDLAFKQRPDLASKYNTWRSKLAAVDQAEANRWPALTVGANLQRSYYQAHVSGGSKDFNGSGHDDGASVNLTFGFGLFDGGGRDYQLKAARHAAEAAKADLAASELGVISDVVSNFVAFKTSAKQVDAAQALLDASQKGYDSVRISYRGGLKSIIDLLTAQSNLALAESTLSQARSGLFLASANLANATGSIMTAASVQQSATTGTAAGPAK